MIPNYALGSSNTLAIPAIAHWFTFVHSVADLQAAIDFTALHDIAMLPIGEGSNIVFGGDYLGLVVQNNIKGIKLIEEDELTVLLEVGGGEYWHELVKTCLRKGWHGLENLALIPGTVGAAPIQNIGAYGVELAESFDSLMYLPINSHEPTTEPKKLSRSQCEFAYRDSIFKHSLRDKVIILSVRLRLAKQAKLNIAYPALKAWLVEHSIETTPQGLFDAVCALRSSKLPDPAQIPNAGSFFKNPVISAQECNELLKRYLNLPHYDVGKNKVKLAAGWMIEYVGWKGRDCESTGMHQDQALVLVNPAKATGERVLAVAKAVAKSVEEEFGVTLEIEPRIYS